MTTWWDEHPCGLERVQRGVNRYEVQPHILPFMEPERWRGKRVLELGCGIGEDAEQFVKHGAEYLGVDNSDIAVRQTLNHEGTRAVQLRADSEGHVPPWVGYFDLVYAFGSLHHMEYPDNALRNAYGYLKNGGTLKLMVYRKPSWKWLQTFWHGTEASPSVPITRAYTPRTIRRMATNAGFQDVKVWRAHHGWHLLVEATK